MRWTSIIVWAAFNSILGLSYAQVEAEKPNNSWFFLYSRQQFSEKISSTVEIHERTTFSGLKHKNFLFRPSIDIHINPNLEFSLGYTIIHSFQTEKEPQKYNQFENNIWEQWFHTFEMGKTNAYQRLRLENRWVQKYNTYYDSTTNSNQFKWEGTTYSNRLRYRLGGSRVLPQISPNFFISLFDEVWINMNPNLQFTNLNRNWVYLGLGYKIGRLSNIQLGYMHQRDFKIENENTHIVQLSYFHNFNFKK